MLSSFENLKKILSQEQKLGCQNTAVIGGLERFANNWLSQALAEATSKEERLTIEKVVAAMKAYADLESMEARQEAIQQITGYLEGESPVQPEDDTKPARSAQKTARPSAEKPASKPEPQRPAPAPKAKVDKTSLDGLNASVTRLPGIKSGYANKLEKLNITTIGDLLTHYPHRYDDYRSLKTINQLEYNEDVTIIAQVWQTKKRSSRANRPIITSILSDGTGTIEATWFNQPWLESKLSPGKQIVVSGRVSQYLGRLVFQAPDWEPLDKTLIHTGRLVPIYPLTSGITAQWMRRLQKRTVDYWAPRLPDHLPDEVLQRQNLPPLEESVAQIHFPDSWEALERSRRRLAFDELLLIQLGVLKQRQLWKAQSCPVLNIDRQMVDDFLNSLPFKLTGAQQRSLDEILADLSAQTPMSRLLQGDVGSGKTVVALAAALAVISDGGQAAVLAPTEILAEQHYKSMGSMLETTGMAGRVNIQLLTGSTKTADREPALAGLADGSTHLLVGTHAIIQENVAFKALRLAVVDEQHRFGVEQRGILREKGINPHMLVMSATPIPRSLALTLYGDLDLSIIDEMPPGRQPIETRQLFPKERERAYSFIRTQVDKGRQAFIICPLVEESDKIEAKSAVEEHERLQKKVFPDLKLGLLHGRMSGSEKESVMADFRDQKIDVLVATSVVEVGIDIPNASTILIEGANRFGLAQLHQFRGRVGRGQDQSYCLLLADIAGQDAKARLAVMERTSNGFELAEEDMKLRGPGEFFGTRQSGLPSLKLVKLTDTQLLELARSEAQAIFQQDADLSKPEHQLLARRVQDFWNKMSDPS